MVGLPVDYCWVWQGQFGDQVGHWFYIKDFVFCRKSLKWLMLGVCIGVDLKKEVLVKECRWRGGAGALFWDGGRLCWCYFWGNWWPKLSYSWNEGAILHHDVYDNIWHHGEKWQRERYVNREAVRFKYLDIVRNHYTYWHNVDDHNNFWQSPIRIEKTWATSQSTNHAFELLLRVTEVNIFLTMTNIYGHEPMKNIEFQKNLSKTLLKNAY